MIGKAWNGIQCVFRLLLGRRVFSESPHSATQSSCCCQWRWLKRFQDFFFFLRSRHSPERSRSALCFLTSPTQTIVGDLGKRLERSLHHTGHNRAKFKCQEVRSLCMSVCVLCCVCHSDDAVFAMQSCECLYATVCMCVQRFWMYRRKHEINQNIRKVCACFYVGKPALLSCLVYSPVNTHWNFSRRIWTVAMYISAYC